MKRKYNILTKKWKKYKKLTPSLQIWMQTKNIGSNSRFAKVYCCPISTYPLHSFSSWDPSSGESQVFCTPSFIDLSLLVFWCTYIAKHFKRSLPSWLSNLVESMSLCIYKKNYKWCSLSISFFMTIKKIEGQIVQTLFL